jgi:hypothetical protein
MQNNPKGYEEEPVQIILQPDFPKLRKLEKILLKINSEVS